MAGLLKTVDNWFLILVVVLLGGYFIWSVQKGLESLLKTIQELKDLIEELFNDRNSHEKRIVRLETRCVIKHGPHGDEEELYQKGEKHGLR